MTNLIFENTALPDVIHLKDVSQTYDGGKTWIIRHLDLLIENIPDQGQFVVILGRSGCGKSTLLRYIAGLQTPTEGEVIIDGKRRTEEMAIAMVSQQYSSLPCRTVLQNVTLPLEYHGVPKNEREDRAMEMIRLVGLECHERKFAKSPQLSGGQLQRVAIARSLVANPSILLMDEPFGALDRHTRFQMQMLLLEIWERLQATIIFVTHDEREAVFLGDDVYIMSSNPAQIVKAFHIDLDFHRTRGTKREPRFYQLVNQVEDALDELAVKTA